MSKFLAPIHSWLFNKINIHEDLEREIEQSFKSKYGDDVTNIVQKNIDKYGERIPNKDLEEIIDESNIHGWLQSKISVAETRQAAILGDLFAEYGNDAIELACDVYKENAIKNAKQAKESITVDAPEDIHKVINNFILDGMPCDGADSIVKSDADILESVQKNCLHINYWNTAGVDVDTMYKLRAEWKKAFVSELNSNFEYSLSGDKDSSFVHTIKRI